MNWLDSLLSASELSEFENACGLYPDRAVRIRDDRTDVPLPFDSTEVDWFARGRFLTDSSVRPATFLQYAACDYYIQDAGSLLPIALLAPKPGEWICDLCAAPGGKASAILESLEGQGLLLANEPIRGRVDSLRYMLSRTGQANYLLSTSDPDDLAFAFAGQFDAVLVDAPCSGQMLVSKEKRDSNAWSPNQIQHSAKRQNRILDAAIQLLRPGGRLVYSTCTFAPEENESQLERIAGLYPGRWAPLQSELLQAWQSPLRDGCYRLWPHRDRCAGGFAGGLVAAQDWEPDSSIYRSSKNKRASSSKKIAHPKDQKAAVDELREFGTFSSDLEPRLWSGDVRIATSAIWDIIERRTELVFPPSVLIPKGSRWLPSHPLSLLRDAWFEPVRTTSFGDREAAQFAAGETVQSASSGTEETGWSVAQWRGASLGWVKNAGNRWNNHLPPWAIIPCRRPPSDRDSVDGSSAGSDSVEISPQWTAK